MPTVAIVGRPNVGKSALFNRLAGRKISIVHDQPGVTRDRIAAPCTLTGHPCTLIDTGGIGATLDDGFGEQVALEADIAMQTADLILFLVDAQEGLTPIDQALAQSLRKAKPPVLLVLNKVDHDKHESSFSDFSRLGIPESVFVSAEHGRNFSELIDKMDETLEPLATEDEEIMEVVEKVGIKLAIIGRPNAGKSSLINAILKDERTIVSSIAGTTRDAVDLPYSFSGENFTLIDTAGLRPRGKRDNSVEVFSAIRSEKAIRRADLCVLVIDLAAGVTAQDRKIAQLILDEKKPCLIVLNKFDLYHPGADYKDRVAEAEDHVRRELFFLSYAPFVACSAKTGDSTDHVLEKSNRHQKGSPRRPRHRQTQPHPPGRDAEKPATDRQQGEARQTLLRHRRAQREIHRHPRPHHRALRQRQAPHEGLVCLLPHQPVPGSTPSPRHPCHLLHPLSQTPRMGTAQEGQPRTLKS